MGEFAAKVFLKFRYTYVSFVSEQLKVLLETKHLYQKVSISPSKLQAELSKLVMGISDEQKTFGDLISNFAGSSFALIDAVAKDQLGPVPSIIVGNVKLYCAPCGAREAFRPIWFSDVTNEVIQKVAAEKYKRRFATDFQLFYIVYQCQRCEGHPEVFFLKRNRTDIFIEGRSPIESVEIPKFIPKEEAHWFRDAIIAFQTGKLLAALFYLRTFIEQFARRKTNLANEKATGEEIMSAYSQTLPSNLRDSMPSLRDWYEQLSACLQARERMKAYLNLPDRALRSTSILGEYMSSPRP